MTDYIGVAPDGPGCCEHEGCTEPGTDNGHCPTHAIKAKVVAALREQSSEATRLIGTPGYNLHDLRTTGRAFDDVADWLADNWSEITGEQG